MAKFLKPLIALFCPLLTLACGPEKGDTGNVSIEMKDATPASFYLETSSYINPSQFLIRPIHISIMKYLNGSNGSGEYGIIWSSANCVPSEGKTTVDDKEYKTLSEENCYSNENDSYIDLAAGETAVNEILNAATYPVVPGVFGGLSISFCNPAERPDLGGTITSSVNTISFRGDEMTENHSYRLCDAYSTAVEGGITISEGQTLKVRLSYDLTKMFTKTVHDNDVSSVARDDRCTLESDNKTNYCAELGQGVFTVTAVLN